MLQSLQWAALGTGFTFLMTTLGAATVFFLSGEPRPRFQRAILNNASRYVRPGGVLLYSTCTVLPEENEEITADFLARRKDFVKEPFSLPGGEEAEGSVTLWPQRHGTDGFYLCKMRKR